MSWSLLFGGISEIYKRLRYGPSERAVPRSPTELGLFSSGFGRKGAVCKVCRDPHVVFLIVYLKYTEPHYYCETCAYEELNFDSRDWGI